ncbi:MAG: hypothetical protein VCD34_06430 [Planctomycetota bacterium]
MLAVGTRMPKWVSDGYSEYSKRMPPHLRLRLKEIAPVKSAPAINSMKRFNSD